MGDTTVRAAIVAYLNAAAVTGIQKWYRDEPWFIQGGSWRLQNNGGWGALGFVHLDSAQENRVTFGGTDGLSPTGSKSVTHTVSLMIQYQYLIPTNKAGSSEDDWVGPIDTMIDAVKALIRADPTLGTSAQGDARPIWEAGQSYNGAPDIRQIRDLPVLDDKKSKILNWNRIEFEVIEMIQA